MPEKTFLFASGKSFLANCQALGKYGDGELMGGGWGRNLDEEDQVKRQLSLITKLGAFLPHKPKKKKVYNITRRWHGW